MPGTRVAVIGGGATGVMAVISILQQAEAANLSDVAVHVLEPQDRLGEGVAYATPHDWHLLNMQAATMSATPNAPDDFLAWVHQRTDEPTIPPDTIERAYLPRRLFGEYLRQRFDDTVRRATRQGLGVTVERCKAIRCQPVGDRIAITTDRGCTLPEFTHAVLCLGDLPSSTYGELHEHPRYLANPWRVGAGIPATARVGVLGSSLTAVDALAHLHGMSHSGPVFCFSRNRGFPKVQPAVLTPYRCRHVTPENLRRLLTHSPQLSLEQVATLFRRELDHATDGRFPWSSLLGSREPTDLHEDIATAEAHPTPWYEALDATSLLVPELWHAMQATAKANFLHRFHRQWASWRHPMPLPNARLLAAMEDQGQLRHYTGIRTVTAGQRGEFDVGYCHQGIDRTQAVDYLINATGTEYNPWLAPSTLLRDMLHRGLLVAHPLGGIDVDFATLRAHTANGTPTDRLYFIGPLTRGVHFYTNSIETNLANTIRMAQHLIGQGADRLPTKSSPLGLRFNSDIHRRIEVLARAEMDSSAA